MRDHVVDGEKVRTLTAREARYLVLRTAAAIVGRDVANGSVWLEEDQDGVTYDDATRARIEREHERLVERLRAQAERVSRSLSQGSRRFR